VAGFLDPSELTDEEKLLSERQMRAQPLVWAFGAQVRYPVAILASQHLVRMAEAAGRSAESISDALEREVLEMRADRSGSTASMLGWTQAEREKIFEFWKDGKNVQEIAEAMGVVSKPDTGRPSAAELKQKLLAHAVVNVNSATQFSDLIAGVTSDGMGVVWKLGRPDETRIKRMLRKIHLNIKAASDLLELTMKVTEDLAD